MKVFVVTIAFLLLVNAAVGKIIFHIQSLTGITPLVSRVLASSTNI